MQYFKLKFENKKNVVVFLIVPSVLNFVSKKIPRNWSEFGEAILESLFFQFAVPWFGLFTIFDEDNKENYDKYMSMKVSKQISLIITFLMNFEQFH